MLSAISFALSLGIHLNNPGLLVKGNDWLGEEEVDGKFEAFSSPEYGIRAMAITLLTYQRKHGLVNLATIGGRYAPRHENATASYITALSKLSGISERDTIDLSDYDTMYKVVVAIIRLENDNYVYPKEVIDCGLISAGIWKESTVNDTR